MWAMMEMLNQFNQSQTSGGKGKSKPSTPALGCGGFGKAAGKGKQDSWGGDSWGGDSWGGDSWGGDSWGQKGAASGGWGQQATSGGWGQQAASSGWGQQAASGGKGGYGKASPAKGAAAGPYANASGAQKGGSKGGGDWYSSGKGGGNGGDMAKMMSMMMSMMGGGGGSTQVKGDKSKMVYVGNLDRSLTWHKVKDFMKAAGNVEFCSILTDDGTEWGRSKGAACVRYSTEQEVAMAIASLNGADFNGRAVKVDKWGSA
eukprot:TRINITY_DN1024_c0_g1_i1.p1 TRINITY_DN1024_c0_g1~~TRINITY_DN1024_c0_g1_i1.p1  ORF type:complete len:259 (+),score=74.35 TRINITY_DN1024_c0_g1_i1:80-856(+)